MSKNAIRFTKMHGIGNDYIYIDCTGASVTSPQKLAIEMSPHHTAVGADGVILICRSDVADFKMRVFNADGSEAMMCGNGSRCVAKYVYDHKLTDKTNITLETLAGIKTVSLIKDDESGEVTGATVDMGEPEFACEKIPVYSRQETMIEKAVPTEQGDIMLTAVSIGNPHGVIWVDSIAQAPVDTLGPQLEHHSMWPNRANIEFAHIVSPTLIEMRVWERGSGETMACGTGACACAVAAMASGRCQRQVDVKLPGGTLNIFWNPDDNRVYMTGPAVTVFDGTYTPTFLKNK
ncbi:MAG: diaminopimelate epimerase [Muribaculum sp.]|nr:diaminopimelate epimerase [Muribaculaceae bacterium]MCM1081573.1 diaminopimelate epimerase [Muribaculum sp.]